MGDDPRRERAERILDVAADLMTSWGCKRVTIDEVARRAGVGKGTVYLHWPTRDALFQAVLIRESLGVLDEILALMDADPVEILPHRLVSNTFALSMRRPLLVALLTKDVDVLDRMVERGEIDSDASVRQMGDYLDVLRRHGLVRADIDNGAQLYVMQVVGTGGCLLEPWLPGSLGLDLDAKATVLAEVIRTSLEPAAAPAEATLAAAATEVVAVTRSLRQQYATAVHPPTADTSRTKG